MSTIQQILTFAYESEYDTAYDLSLKHSFSNPKIYNAKGDIKKRWYVYFSFRNPETGKLKRVTPFYGKANKYKTKEQRMEVLIVYRKTLLQLLKQGYNPFSDNTSLHLSLQSKKSISKDKLDKEEISSTSKITELTIKEAFAYGLKLKEKLLSTSTKRGYENRIKIFLEWLEKNRPEVKCISELNKKVVSQFLNDVLDKTSARNRNNYRTDLSSLIQALEDNDIVATNFVKKIVVLKSIPQRNKTYSIEEQEAIFNYLKDTDPLLLLYIKFVSYNLLRPLEVCRLKIGDIDLVTKTLKFKAKNTPLKTKIIPDLLIQDLPDLSKMKKSWFLFTNTDIGGVWDSNEESKRNYFSKRFKKVVKEHFNLGEDYGLYSFRHTYITKLYRALVKESSPFEAKSKLKLITGHSSMSALEKYLRDIDAELPADYSEMLKNNG